MTGVIAAVVSAVAVVVSGWAAYRATTKAKTIEASAAPYEQLSARVSALEAQVSGLLSDQWVDRTYMRQLLAAWPTGHPLPLPMPPWLARHYGYEPRHPPTPGSILELPEGG